MFDPEQASASPRSRRAAAAISERSFVPERARLQALAAVGRQLNRAIRFPVLACLMWRAAVYRIRHRTGLPEGVSR